ncbi:hypothetical protein [Bdellovibrio bacteriovorus]|uniref:hypothetical protein n=1 Tax=Bdellovibrio TaxID=958 RepID=UPI0035A85E8C
MEIVAILIPIISGIIGGNVAGSALKKFSLGPVGNSIVGLLGGAGGGALLGMFGGGADPTPLTTSAGSVDIGALVAGIAGGGVGGGVLMSIVGLIKDKMAKRP